MVIEYFCKGCGHCRIDNGEDIDDGLCPQCQQRRDFPEPKRRKLPVSLRDFAFIALGLSSFYLGYLYPRDVELESTAPVYFVLNADLQAATLLAKQCKPSDDK